MNGLKKFNKAFIYKYFKVYAAKKGDNNIDEKIQILGAYLLPLDDDVAWQEKRERAKTTRKESNAESKFTEMPQNLDENDLRCFAPMCCVKVEHRTEGENTQELQEQHIFDATEIQVLLSEYPDHIFRQAIDTAISYTDQILVYKRIKQLIRDFNVPFHFEWSKDLLPKRDGNCFGYFYKCLSFCTPQKKKEIKDSIQQFEDQIFTNAFDVIWKNGMSAAHGVWNFFFCNSINCTITEFLDFGSFEFPLQCRFFCDFGGCDYWTFRCCI